MVVICLYHLYQILHHVSLYHHFHHSSAGFIICIDFSSSSLFFMIFMIIHHVSIPLIFIIFHDCHSHLFSQFHFSSYFNHFLEFLIFLHNFHHCSFSLMSFHMFHHDASLSCGACSHLLLLFFLFFVEPYFDFLILDLELRIIFIILNMFFHSHGFDHVSYFCIY